MDVLQNNCHIDIKHSRDLLILYCIRLMYLEVINVFFVD